ncbi:MAG: glycosyltransferase family 4 protein [Thermoguttaceae bacterium]|jgi:glycosyltransferase involved in cell wall biosynthesis
MKILLCHNFYQQLGGEDLLFNEEAQLLESHGQTVLRFTLHNDSIPRMNRLGLARRTIWNRSVHAELRRLIRQERPDLMHCTNTFPLISPAAYYAARDERIAVVQALQNYRLLCPAACFLREHRVCEDCLGKFIPWPAVLHACYRQSRAASFVVGAMLSGHRLWGTWKKAVTLYSTPSEFTRQKYIEGGLPADRIAVKPNFVSVDPGLGTGSGGFGVFVGRLSPEKGLDSVLKAWPRLGGRLPLKIVGDGPGRDLAVAAAAHPEIQWLGHRPIREVLEIVGEAACLVMPSIWYEPFGRTIVEAFAKGTPVIGSRIGAIAELINDGHNGLLFRPGDPDDLEAKLRQFLADPQAAAKMRLAARCEYEAKYTAETNYQLLMEIYQKALGLKPLAVTA